MRIFNSRFFTLINPIWEGNLCTEHSFKIHHFPLEFYAVPTGSKLTPPLLLGAAKAGSRHWNKYNIPLLPIRIGERHSLTISII